MKFLALDFGGTFVKHCLLDEDLNITEKNEVPAPLSSTDEWIKVIVDLYNKYKNDIDGIAISMPGVLDTDKGIAHSGGAYGKTVQGKNIYELLKPYIDIPVCIENDAKSAILAEQWQGSLKGVNTACACIIGSGLGGGIIMDGKIQKGEHFASGEISALLTIPGDYSPNSWAAFSSSTSGLLMMVAKAKGMDIKDFEISGFMGGSEDSTKKKIGGREVIQWVEDGDEVTTEVYKKWIKNLTSVLFNMKMMIDPQKIVVGGGISRNPRVINDLKEEWNNVCQFLTSMGIPTAELDVCKFTSDANLVGAVYSWILKYKH